MNNKILFLIVAAIIIFVGSGYIFNKNKISKEREANERTEAIKEIEAKPERTLDIKHQFKDGKNIFVGKVQTPSPCHKVEKSITKNNENFYLNIDVKNPPEGSVCAQVITDQPFSFEFLGTENDIVYARINGELVNLNIFEIPADKNIEDVEIFIKG